MKIKTILRKERGEFPGWLRERFGDHYAQLSVDSTLKLRMAIKDVSRFKRGFVSPELELLCKQMLMPPQGVNDKDFIFGYDNDEGHVEGSLNYDKALQEYVKKYQEDWEIVQKAIGLVRQKGRHACAFLIANQPIHTFIPLTTVSDVRVTAFTAGPVEAVGGLKMDFLVVSAVKDIADCIKLIQARHAGGPIPGQPLNGRWVEGHHIVPHGAEQYDIWNMPEDQAVFADTSEGKTETVFQLNTPSATQWLRQFNYKKANGNKAIDSIAAVAAFTALDRPGPLDAMVTNPETGEKHNTLVEFARRARGAAPSQDIIQAFNELLPETYGVLTFQEQLQRVYQHLTGCSGPEAEEFRTNVAKKKKDKVDAAYAPFLERAGAKLGTEVAQQVWQFFVSWGQYGFNLSHATCYAIIGYACAWLKHYYPLEWWCSVLNNADKDEINETFWRYCGKFINLPSVGAVTANFEIQGKHIQAPIRLLHGIGEKAQAQLVKYAPYSDLEDFCKKIQAHREAGARIEKRTKTSKDKRTGEEKQSVTTVRVLGRSALTAGAIRTLIISGAMDSLFPADMPVGDRMVKYDEVMKSVGSGKVTPVADKKRTHNHTPLERYQIRKKILPAYGEDLRPLVAQTTTPSIHLSDGKLYWKWYLNVPFEGKVEYKDPFISCDRLDALQSLTMLPDRGIRCAVVGYVENARFFNYGPSKEKEALELTLEVGGAKYKMVAWPERDTGKLPKEFKGVKIGAIATALITRTREDKPFSIKDLELVQQPYEENDEEE